MANASVHEPSLAEWPSMRLVCFLSCLLSSSCASLIAKFNYLLHEVRYADAFRMFGLVSEIDLGFIRHIPAVRPEGARHIL